MWCFFIQSKDSAEESGSDKAVHVIGLRQAFKVKQNSFIADGGNMLKNPSKAEVS